jgi:replicative DNA helicase
LGKAETWRAAREEIKRARPELHHLREGGSEQEADLVLGLLNYRADLPKETGGLEPPDVSLFEVGVLKSRYGETGAWSSLAFVARGQFIRNPDPGEVERL